MPYYRFPDARVSQVEALSNFDDVQKQTSELPRLNAVDYVAQLLRKLIWHFMNIWSEISSFYLKTFTCNAVLITLRHGHFVSLTLVM